MRQTTARHLQGQNQVPDPSSARDLNTAHGAIFCGRLLRGTYKDRKSNYLAKGNRRKRQYSLVLEYEQVINRHLLVDRKMSFRCPFKWKSRLRETLGSVKYSGFKRLFSVSLSHVV